MQQGAPKRILVVDDDEAQRRLIATVLEHNRYQVLTAPDPVAALQLLSRETVDLVLTDLMMPHADGIALAEQIHRLPHLERVPIVLMSAWSDEELFEKGLRRGIAMTLQKPLKMEKLLDLVGFAVH